MGSEREPDVADATPVDDAAIDAAVDAPYSRRLLVAGILGRTWLWFVGGCLVVTLLPLLFGWRPFVIESGSMEPRINVGDVILASPNDNPDEMLGRVVVFTDPDYPSRVKSHRIVAINDDGTMVSKGDANRTNDSVPVPVSNVRGLGRLLVGFVGLPLIWVNTGQWTWLVLFLASLLAATLAVSRDHEDEVEVDDDTDAGDGPPGDLIPLPSRTGTNPGTSIAASTPLDPGLRFTSRAPRWVLRTAYAVLLASVVGVPTAGAAFAATTKSTTNTWRIPNWDYTADLLALSPWLYWKLDETGTGTTAADTSGNGRTGTYNANGSATYFTKGIVGALPTDTPNRGVTLTNAASCINTTSTTAINAPAQLTEIVWFKSTSTTGGKLLGFEQPRTGIAAAGSGGTYDRHLYMDGAGKVWFGVYNNGDSLISSPGALNDGQWHMAVGTLGTPGMKLYIDGTLVGTNPNTVGEPTTGWWRAGCGNLAGWGDGWTGGNSPTMNSTPAKNYPFTGSLDEVSIWHSVLTAAQIQALYVAR